MQPHKDVLANNEALSTVFHNHEALIVNYEASYSLVGKLSWFIMTAQKALLEQYDALPGISLSSKGQGHILRAPY